MALRGHFPWTKMITLYSPSRLAIFHAGHNKDGDLMVACVGYNGDQYGYFYGTEHVVEGDPNSYRYEVIEFFRKMTEETYQEAITAFREYVARAKSSD